jgi:hypothetical protein
MLRKFDPAIPDMITSVSLARGPTSPLTTFHQAYKTIIITSPWMLSACAMHLALASPSLPLRFLAML